MLAKLQPVQLCCRIAHSVCALSRGFNADRTSSLRLPGRKRRGLPRRIPPRRSRIGNTGVLWALRVRTPERLADATLVDTLDRARHFCWFVICGFGLAFDQVHGVQDCFDDRFVPDRGIDHYVVEGAGGPVGAEVVFDERDAFAVNGVD